MKKANILGYNTNVERTYFKTYHDFLYNDFLDGDEKLIFTVLKSFLDFSKDKNGTHGKVFPTIKKLCRITKWCNQKVTKVIKRLINKGLVEKIRRGLNKSNVYILSDYAQTWADEVDSSEEIEEIVYNDETEPTTAEEYIAKLEAMGYTVEIKEKKSVSDNTIVSQDELVEQNKVTEMEEKIESMPENVAVQEKEPVLNNVAMLKNENTTIGKKIVSKLKSVVGKEKEPTSAPTKVANVSLNNNKISSSNDDTTKTAESQPLEQYSLDWLKEHFCYNAMIDKYPKYQKNIDSVMHILYTTLNTTNKIIRIKGDKKPAIVVKSKLLKLKDEDIIYAIEQFLKQTVKIKNTTAYMITLLYNAPEQRQLDMENSKQHDKAQKNGQASNPNQQQSPKWEPSKNQFFQFNQREVTPEELKELERKLLAN